MRSDLPAARDPSPPGLPDPPASQTAAAARETQIELSWIAREDMGGSVIVGDRIDVSTDVGMSRNDLTADTGTPQGTIESPVSPVNAPDGQHLVVLARVDARPGGVLV